MENVHELAFHMGWQVGWNCMEVTMWTNWHLVTHDSDKPIDRHDLAGAALQKC